MGMRRLEKEIWRRALPDALGDNVGVILVDY